MNEQIQEALNLLNLNENSESFVEHYYTIDVLLRKIKNLSDKDIAGVRGDKDVNVIHFISSRYYHGIDLSELNIRVNYVNANGEPNYYEINTMTVNSDTITFDWLITNDAVKYEGDLSFSVQMFKLVGDKIQNNFYTEISILKVLDGIDVEHYVDPGEVESLIEHVTEEVLENISFDVEDIERRLDIAEDNIDYLMTQTEIVHMDTEANWNLQRDLIAQRGHFYIYTDHEYYDGAYIPGIKIGDGTSYLIDIAFVNGGDITPEQKAFWNNKVTCYISQNDSENLTFSKI